MISSSSTTSTEPFLAFLFSVLIKRDSLLTSQRKIHPQITQRSAQQRKVYLCNRWMDLIPDSLEARACAGGGECDAECRAVTRRAVDSDSARVFLNDAVRHR